MGHIAGTHCNLFLPWCPPVGSWLYCMTSLCYVSVIFPHYPMESSLFLLHFHWRLVSKWPLEIWSFLFILSHILECLQSLWLQPIQSFWTHPGLSVLIIAIFNSWCDIFKYLSCFNLVLMLSLPLKDCYCLLACLLHFIERNTCEILGKTSWGKYPFSVTFCVYFHNLGCGLSDVFVDMKG